MQLCMLYAVYQTILVFAISDGLCLRLEYTQYQVINSETCGVNITISFQLHLLICVNRIRYGNKLVSVTPSFKMSPPCRT
jgi:hypothetical protein